VVARHPAVTVTDHTAGWATLAVVGRRAPELLASLGVYGPSGDPRQAAPVAVCQVGPARAVWLLCSDTRALAALPRAAAPGLWRTIERAGRPLGICAVGEEALARYELIRPSTGL
jgi:glycine cleavage system aminomethyltransferase T